MSQTQQVNLPTKLIASWLFICALCVVIMVIIGGVTRLTHSGLSIVEWKPVTGIVPPLNEAEWAKEYSKYQLIPEYQISNIALPKFKQIYLIEYIHRLAARLTGLVFLLPFLYFLSKKMITPKIAANFVTIFCLGLLQGVIGWYMVKSGLHGRYDISQYRLALHLAMGFVIFALIIWAALSAYYNYPLIRPVKEINILSSHANLLIFNIFLQVIIGGFVAGLDAGLIYNTFPLMDGDFIPQGLFNLQPFYRNLFENVTTVQFIHRIVAYILCINIIFFIARIYCYKYSKELKKAAILLMFVLIIQMSLGIATLLYNVPLVLALLHQLGALILLFASLYNRYIICYRVCVIKAEAELLQS
jgi:cytochrome c oxidase assembly protein subunit 15